MKGMVFTEFTEMVEAQFSPETLDRIILAADLPGDGAYTAVGTYDHQELLRMVAALSREVAVPVDELVQAFGRHLFARFVQMFPRFFETANTAFGFLSHIEDYIHHEVRKLYPDAELPRFECRRLADQGLEMTYASGRCMADLAEGLIRGCAEHFGEDIAVRRENLQTDGSLVRFTLTRRDRS